MAISNRDRVARVMDLLKEGLGPFVLREYKMVYKGSGYVREIDDALRTSAYELPRDFVLDPANVEETLLAHIDAHGWLNLMWRRWNDVFREKLGHAERSYISELMEARNAWAHQRAFSNDDAYRVADTAHLNTRQLDHVCISRDYRSGDYQNRSEEVIIAQHDIRRTAG